MSHIMDVIDNVGHYMDVIEGFWGSGPAVDQ